MKEIILEGRKILNTPYLLGIFTGLGSGEDTEVIYEVHDNWVREYGYNLDAFRDWVGELRGDNPDGLIIIWKDSQISRENILKDPANLELKKIRLTDYFREIVDIFLEAGYINEKGDFEGIELRLE